MLKLTGLKLDLDKSFIFMLPAEALVIAVYSLTRAEGIDRIAATMNRERRMMF